MPKHRRTSSRRHGRFTACALSAGLGFTALIPVVTAPAAYAAEQDIVSVGAPVRQADAQIILEEINRYRASLGIKPLKYSATLSQVVQKESDRQVIEERVSHSTNFLTDPRTGPWTSANEIIAYEHHRDVRALVKWWTSSAAHDKALKDPRHEVLGIGLTYADGSLASTGAGWQVLSTVNLYGYANGGAPSDASTSVGDAAASLSLSSTSTLNTPAYSLTGSIGQKHYALGGAGAIGHPVMNERGGLRDGGVYQEFMLDTRKSTIYWSPATGSHWMKNYGAIGQKFIQGGREHGYGYPVTDEITNGTTVHQRFSNGYTIHWSQGQGTWVTAG